MERMGERGNPDAVHARGGTSMNAVVWCRYDLREAVEVVTPAGQADDLVAQEPDARRGV